MLRENVADQLRAVESRLQSEIANLRLSSESEIANLQLKLDTHTRTSRTEADVGKVSPCHGSQGKIVRCLQGPSAQLTVGVPLRLIRSVQSSNC